MVINPSKQQTHNLMSFAFSSFADDVTSLIIPLEVLASSTHYQEHWGATQSVAFEQHPWGRQWRSATELVLAFEPDVSDIMSMTEFVYQRALSQATNFGYLNLIRTWNYFPRINDNEEGLERYQRFCVARQMVLNQFPVFEKQNPAATAIGSMSDGVSFVFFFAHTSGCCIENNRQIPAWQYPEQYAPKQPRFARAMMYQGLLMCSGTASVVGHETQHEGDFEAQFHETLKNIKQLLLEAGQPTSLSHGLFRFYIRDVVFIEILEVLVKSTTIEHYVILLGSVCRTSLLLECEAVFQIE